MKRLLACLLLFCAACGKKEAHGPIGKLHAERREKVAACAKCHEKEAKAEAEGPHSRSYESAIRQWHVAMKEPDKSPRLARDLREAGDISHCLRCHSPTKTVFDDSISSAWSGSGIPPWKELTVERGEEIQAGGVDCLTCHAEGDRVVTRADYVRTAGSKPPCDPKASPAFSRSASCVVCHEPAVTPYAHKLAASSPARKSPYLDCADCHMEKDSSGRRGHYWYRDGDGKKLEALTKPMFKGFVAKVERTKSGRSLLLRWPLDFVPHEMIPKTPKLYIVTVELLAPGAPAFSKTIRVFSPLEDLTAEDIRERNPGEIVSVPPMGTFERRYELPPGVGETGVVRLTVLKKPNGDFRDDSAWPVLTREIKL